jgi:hypothetical protein
MISAGVKMGVQWVGTTKSWLAHCPFLKPTVCSGIASMNKGGLHIGKAARLIKLKYIFRFRVRLFQGLYPSSS